MAFLKFFKMLVLSVFFGIVFCFSLFAKPVSSDDARIVSENYLNYITENDSSWGKFQKAECVNLEPIFVDELLVGYVVHISPIGFILISGDDELPPVKAFSTDAFFAQDANEFYKWVCEELKAYITALRSESNFKPIFDETNRKLWNRFLLNYKEFESQPVIYTVPPPYLTSTVWDQMDPYNRLCPEYNGQRCPVGCVATATAQVMKYWSFPPQGTGSESYTSRSHRFQLSANFDHPYSWDLMLDSYGFSATEEQKNAVAQLCYDLGVAFHMDYDPEGSGAYTTDAVQILPKYFYYSNQMSSENYPGNDQDWFNLFKNEIDNGRPALMSIRGDAGGHAVVCDGYRTDTGNMLHLNFGWGGMGNTYFAINNIVVAGNDFTWVDGQEIIKNIYPNEQQPVACYASASPMGGKAPVTVSVAGQGKRGVAPYTYSWDFGDGTTGMGQFTSHIYNDPGTYTITLLVTDSVGQTSTDDHLKINVTSSTGLSATAQASVTSGKAPLVVDFTAVAQGGVPSYTYIWNFGDGTSETTVNTTISHTYTTAGTFTAVLTVKDSVNAQTTATGIQITVQPSEPQPQITGVKKLTSPFRIKVSGSNFKPSSIIKIDGNPVPLTVYKNETTLLAKGGTTLKNMCPKGVTVKITVDNGNGNISNEYSFTR